MPSDGAIMILSNKLGSELYMIKKLLVASAVSILLLFSAINAKAATFTDNQVVDANRNWTIHFSQTVFLDDPLKQNIKVVDSEGKKANITFNFGQDEKTIIVNAPQDGYTAGEKYTLTIDGYVHSKMDKSINEAVKLNFSVKDYAVTFKDKTLEQIIRNKINKPTGDILKSDVEKITDLSAKNVGISNISGIENLNNLQCLDLSGSKISDINALKDLKKLGEIYLDNTQVSDISALSNLTDLWVLSLNNTQVTDISVLKKFTNSLSTINLKNDKISDVSILKNFKGLQSIDLDGTGVSDSDKQDLRKILLPTFDVTNLE